MGGWLVLDLPVNQIHQETVAEEIKIMEQWEVAGGKKKKKKRGPGFPKYMRHHSEATAVV